MRTRVAVAALLVILAAPAGAQSPSASSGREGGARVLQLSPDGFSLAQVDNHVIHIWDVAHGKERSKVKSGDAPIDAIMFSPDSSVLLAISSTTVRLWDAATGAERPDLGSGRHASAAAFSPDGGQMALTHGASTSVWELAARREAIILRDPQGIEATSVIFSLDGQTLIVGGADKSVRLWDYKTGRLTQVLGGNRGF
jgi:WD40 repeat protein